MNILEDILEQSRPIEELSALDLKTFEKKYFNNKCPVLIKGLAKDWGATKKWNFNFFLNLKEDKEILTLSKNYIHDDQNFKKSTFKDYIGKLNKADKEGSDLDDFLTSLDIFEFYPNLKSDIDFFIFDKLTKTKDTRAWLGPKGTISGFHADTPDNMYAQIKGKKLFIICSTEFNRNMYPSDKHIYEATASLVDINNFDFEKFPKFKKIDFKFVILEPGDVLYLPQKWWHYVQALETSISISNFGYTTFDSYTVKIFERIKHSLHKRGYFKTKNCFCCD